MSAKNTYSNNLTTALITGVWTVVACVVTSRHEIWLDEAQHWLLARDSDSLGQLYNNMRYEGHPPLWNLLLFLLSRISASPAIMQYAHLAFAGGTVFLVARYAPFPLWTRMLLPFTFFLGYEYAVIARNHAPAVFFVVLACVWSRSLNRNLTRISVALGIALLFHLYAGCIALVLLLYFLWKLKKENEMQIMRWTPLVILSVPGLIAVWFLLIVPHDHFITEYHATILEFDRIGTILLLPFTALLHVPELTKEYWWNTNLFLQGPELVKGIIGLVFWFIPALVFRKDRPALVLYVGGTLLLSAVMLLTPMAVTVRHAGFVAIFFLVCVWVGEKSLYVVKLSKIILAGVLIVQVSAYCITVYKECTQPFSNSKNVADFVRERYPEMKIAGYPLFISPPVSAYLEKDIFYPDAEGNFASWKRSAVEMRPDEFMQECKDYMTAQNLDSMVVIGHLGYKTFELHSAELQLRTIFRGAAVSAEDYGVYILTRE